METIISRNPADGSVLKEIPATPPSSLPEIFSKSRIAQEKWASYSLKKRAEILRQLREVLIDHIDDLSLLVSQENGKPRFEAMVNEILPTIELITYFTKKGPNLLKNKPIPLGLMKHRTSYLQYWPLGVVAVISPWNYPFLLPFGEIIMALMAGNAVVFKPSEVTPLIGLKIQELCEEAGLPNDLVQAIIGDGSLGSAIIHQRPAKIFFTGSVATGKRIMAAASEYLIPVNLELGGKDAMIVLADADLDYATSAALWGGFSNSGQICASVERLLVHESIAKPFTQQLKNKLSRLRPAHSADYTDDLGFITSDKQKEIYKKQLEDARAMGAEFIAGGNFSESDRALQPTIVTGSNIESLEIYNEETFGPVIAMTTFRSIDEAVQKANKSRYGLLASVITKNQALGERVARQLEVGTVTINEVLYTAGLPETPWGGMKDSGFGKKHSDLGLLEFVNTRHIHKPRFSRLVFKSLWWFPYTPYQYAFFRQFAELYRRSWFDKIRAFPMYVWTLVRFLKREKRL